MPQGPRAQFEHNPDAAFAEEHLDKYGQYVPPQKVAPLSPRLVDPPGFAADQGGYGDGFSKTADIVPRHPQLLSSKVAPENKSGTEAKILPDPPLSLSTNQEPSASPRRSQQKPQDDQMEMIRKRLR